MTIWFVMSSERIRFTHHAVDRYVKRFAPALRHSEARSELEDATVSAVRLKERTMLGDEQWEIPILGVIIVVKRDPGRTEIVCVTVLPDHRNGGMTLDELERIHEHMEVVKEREAEAVRHMQAIQVEQGKKPTGAPGSSSPAGVAAFIAIQRAKGGKHSAKEAAEKVAKEARKAERARLTEERESLARTVAKDRAVDLETARTALAAVQVDLERTKIDAKVVMHAISSQENRDGRMREAKAALRVAIRALVERGDRSVLDAIAAIQPGFVTPAFYEPSPGFDGTEPMA